LSITSLFWFSLTVLFAILIVYPYLIYPFILKLLPKNPVQIKDLHKSDGLTIAMLFCAYNEESSLPNKIRNIRELKNTCPELKVYAYSDGSTDATNELLLSAQDVLEPLIGNERLGKVVGMQKLVAKVREDIIVFTDANVLLEPESLTRLLYYFSDPSVGCVSGKLVYKGMSSTTAKVGGLYWKLEEKIKQLETDTGSTMGADGAVFARLRIDYPEIPPGLVDDMAVSMSVLFENKRCITACDVIAYENAVCSGAEEFRRKIRIACGAYSTYLYQRKEIKKTTLINQFKFISHKLIRWWGAFFMLAANITFTFWGYSIGYGNELLATLAVTSMLFWLLGSRGIPGISAVYEIILSIIATGIGVIKSLSGTEYRTWETAATR